MIVLFFYKSLINIKKYLFILEFNIIIIKIYKILIEII